MEKQFKVNGYKQSKAGYYVLDYEEITEAFGDFYNSVEKLRDVKIEPSLANIDKYRELFIRLRRLALIASGLFVSLQTAANQTQDMFELAKSIIEQEEYEFADSLIGIVSIGGELYEQN